MPRGRIDRSAFPHIVDSVRDEADLPTLLALRGTSRSFHNQKHDTAVRNQLARRMRLIDGPGEPTLAFAGTNVPQYMAGERVSIASTARGGPNHKLLSHMKRLDLEVSTSYWGALPRTSSLKTINVVRGQYGRLPPCDTVIIGPNTGVSLAPSDIKRLVLNNRDNAIPSLYQPVTYVIGGKLREVIITNEPPVAVIHWLIYMTVESRLRMTIGRAAVVGVSEQTFMSERNRILDSPAHFHHKALVSSTLKKIKMSFPTQQQYQEMRRKWGVGE